MHEVKQAPPDIYVMPQADLFYRFGVALFIGILIGLEREHTAELQGRKRFAGIRTFPLMSLAGCTGAFLTDITSSPWPFVAVLVMLGTLIALAYRSNVDKTGRIGSTTEFSSIITILAGALCYWDYLALAVAISVVTTVLLSLKLEMHRFAQGISRPDVYATLKFAVITAIILPVLPNQTFGPPPFDVLNPYRIWLMVVFISGMSFLGYVLIKLVHVQHAIGLTGLLGGMVSSTAVTMSFSERSQNRPIFAKSFGLAIIVAWAIMYMRMMIEVVVINQGLIYVVWLPLTAAAIAAILYAAYLFLGEGGANSEGMTFSNPFELRPALTFGALYAAILLISRVADLYLGHSGVYLSSLLAGLADVNAITLSMAELSKEVGGLDHQTAATAIVLAGISNTAVKAGIVFATASTGLRRIIWPGVILILIVSVGAMFVI